MEWLQNDTKMDGRTFGSIQLGIKCLTALVPYIYDNSSDHAKTIRLYIHVLVLKYNIEKPNRCVSNSG